MADLRVSRWAPSELLNQEPKAAVGLRDLRKCDRLLCRLRWKASLLLTSHLRATAASFDGFPKHEAQTMFKVDFFEFYLLLERFLLHLLDIFRVPVKRQTLASISGPDANKASTTGKENMIIGSSAGPLRYHRFHAEVLSALDQPANPLHPILGVGPIRTHLQAAKDFRNQWKDALEESSTPMRNKEDSDSYRQWQHRDRLVEDLDLSNMLQSITDALLIARDLAQSNINAQNESIELNTKQGEGNEALTWASPEMMDCDSEDMPWEAIQDAMDWETD